jgi:hypothetical protein
MSQLQQIIDSVFTEAMDLIELYSRDALAWEYLERIGAHPND